jgi:acetylornithine/succinyldiaminopimelate/putrescine aminotransferase/predicted amino acid dehydrogenase
VSHSQRYTQYCKPGLGKLLQAFGLDVAYEKAEGDWLTYHDAEGREHRVLDLVGSYGATLFGHNPPELLETLKSCLAARVPHLVQASIRPGAARLAEILASEAFRRLGAEYVVAPFSTGAEAIEAAMKQLMLVRRDRLRELETTIVTRVAAGLRRFPALRCSPDAVARIPALATVDSPNGLLKILAAHNRDIAARPGFFAALERGFHGKTLGALSVTHNERYRDPFAAYILPVRFLAHDTAALTRVLAETHELLELEPGADGWRPVSRPVPACLGLLLEPVLGEGGARPLNKGFVQEVFGAAKQAGVPVVADEIQSGMGRCGALFALETFGVPAPDVVVLSKCLGGGIMKLSAVLTKKELYPEEFGIIHTSTFAEDDLSCRLGVKVIETLIANEDQCLRAIREKGERWRHKLATLETLFPEVIQRVQGLGLLIGVEFRDLSDSGSHFLRFLQNQGDFGYFVAGYLLYEQGIRVAPGLNASRTIRVEPSMLVSDAELERVFEALSGLCEILRDRDTALLARFLVSGGDLAAAPEAASPGASPAARWPRVSYGRDFRQFMQETPLPAAKVAFLGHFIDGSFLARHEPPFQRFSRAELDRLVARTWSYLDPCIFVRRTITSATGAEVGFHFVGLSVTSEILFEHLQRRDVRAIRVQIAAAVEVAKNADCRLVGFGQFTSILTNNCQAFARPDVSFTTGNTLTAGMAFEGIQTALAGQGRRLPECAAAVIGAGGNIGATFSRLLADQVESLTLVGGRSADSASRLHRTLFGILQDRLDEPQTAGGRLARRAREWLTPDESRQLREIGAEAREAVAVGRALWERLAGLPPADRFIRLAFDGDVTACDVIVGAANSPQPFLGAADIKPGAVVCDVSIPSMLKPDVWRTPGITALKGGVVALPHHEKLNIDALPLEPGLVYACMAETILLGLENRWESYSVGDIQKERVLEMLQIARKHGFTLARLKNEDAM